MLYFIYLLIGAFAGTLSGLLGIGGGIIIVPALALLFQYQHIFPNALNIHMAVGTSLGCMIFTSISSAYSYHQKRLIIWPIFYRFIPGLSLGIVFGSIVAKHLSSNHLSLLFSIFLLLITFNLFFSNKNNKKLPQISYEIEHEIPNIILLIFSSFVIGMLSGFFGIGGGAIMIPCFIFFGFAIQNASATSALCTIPLAIIGTISLIYTGFDEVKAQAISPLIASGFVYWPGVLLITSTSIIFARVGVSLAIKSEAKILKRILAILLIISAYNLFKISLS